MIPLFSWLLRPETVLTPEDRAVGTHVIGVPKTGKSFLLEDWAWQDIVAGRGVCVIDPAGDLFESLLARAAANPSVHDRLIVLDPTDPDCPVKMNPLVPMPGQHPERLASYLSDIVVSIYQLDVAAYPRMMQMMENAFAALIALRLSLLELPRFLLDKKYRDQFLPLLPPELEHVRIYFNQHFPANPNVALQWYQPLANKIERLLFDRGVRRLIAGSPILDFRAILDTNRVLLVNVPKGILGDNTSGLFAGFVVAMFQKAALSRTDTKDRPPYHLYLDEFQNYTTDNISDILTESRKYGLSLILAHQTFTRIPPDIKSTVLNVIGSTITFRIGVEDAKEMAPAVFRSGDTGVEPPPLQHVERGGRIPFMRFEERHVQPNWDRAQQALINLENRQMYLRKRGNYQPVQLRTRTVKPVKITPQLQPVIKQLRQRLDPACMMEVPPPVVPQEKKKKPARQPTRPREVTQPADKQVANKEKAKTTQTQKSSNPQKSDR